MDKRQEEMLRTFLKEYSFLECMDSIRGLYEEEKPQLPYLKGRLEGACIALGCTYRIDEYGKSGYMGYILHNGKPVIKIELGAY